MTGNVIADTNIIIALFKNDKDIIQKLSDSDDLILPVMVLGELYFGVFNSKNKLSNLNKINELITNFSVLGIDENTSKYYGEIKAKLKVNGTPIPENDIWIAALGKQYGIKIVTRDEHFMLIDDLLIEKW